MNRDRLIALGVTVLTALLLFLWLRLTVISSASARIPNAPQPEEPEIFFADIDYQQILSNPTPMVDGEVASAAASDDGGVDLTDSGSGEAVPDVVTSTDPQPENVQVVEPEEQKPSGPTKEEIEEQKRAEIRAKFGKATGLKATEEQAAGSAASGNASTGNNPQSSGLGLDGRKLQNRPDPGIKNAQGSVTVRVTVNAEGHVTYAAFVKSSGFGSREAEVRRACVNASRQLRYSPDPGRPSQSGNITWHIK